MPYKHSAKIRDKFDKPRYKVTNWPTYINALRNRGSFTVYFTEEAKADWHPQKTGSRGSPQKYSALAIETSLMNSLVTVLGIDITIPDFSCLSKRSISLPRYKLTKERILKRLIEKSLIRELPVDPDAMSNADIRRRAEERYSELADEIEGDLPEFGHVYDFVEVFYRGLPWRKG